MKKEIIWTDEILHALQPKDKTYILCVKHSLYLIVYKSGHKSWHFRGRKKGKPVSFTHGYFSDLSLEEANEHLLQWINAQNIKGRIDESCVTKAKQMKIDGVSNNMIAKHLGVCNKTISNWFKNHNLTLGENYGR